jgi:hypothetical protein
VDEGKTSTNVTRLERMIRNADAFIGVYPFEPVDIPRPDIQNLRDGSRYFRLELDLAARAQKPGLVFIDSRYGNVLYPSGSISHETFNIQEILTSGARPNTPKFEQAFRDFHDRVVISKKFRVSELRFERVTNQVGIWTPPDCYGQEHIGFLRDTILNAGFDPVVLDWQEALTPRLIGQLRTFDWTVIDIGPASVATGMVGYLHGAFVPAMRMLKVADVGLPQSTPSALYAGVSVGYKKDIIQWSNFEMFQNEVARRVDSLNFGTDTISTKQKAMQYFRKAAHRKEPVFLSYAGGDEAESEDFRAALKERFQDVFDYRDDTSLPPGKPWIGQIFQEIGQRPIGILLLSAYYVASGNCMHELQQMVASNDQERMQLFPVKLRKGEKFKMPPEISITQYLRYWEYDSANELIDRIISYLPAK